MICIKDYLLENEVNRNFRKSFGLRFVFIILAKFFQRKKMMEITDVLMAINKARKERTRKYSFIIHSQFLLLV